MKKQKDNMVNKLPKNYYLIGCSNVETKNNECYELLFNAHNHVLVTTNLYFDVNCVDDAICGVWDHLNVINLDLQEPITIAFNYLSNKNNTPMEKEKAPIEIMESSSKYLPFIEAREFIRKLGLKNKKEWDDYCISGLKPDNIPSNPEIIYKQPVPKL
jgi:hypothetical protein